LRSAERAVSLAAYLMLSPILVLAVLEWSIFTPIVLTAFVLAGAGVLYLRDTLFLLGAGGALLGTALLAPGPFVILLFVLEPFSMMVGSRAIRLSRDHATSTWSGSYELSRSYLSSVLFLGLEFLIGGVLTLLMLTISPIWHFPSWTVLELGVVLTALLSLLTYWLLRTRGDVQKV
jgi:hypothetical protein